MNRCQGCGSPLLQPRTGRHRRWCSESCRSRARRLRARGLAPIPSSQAPAGGGAGAPPAGDWDARRVLAERAHLLEVLLARGERISASEAESARRLLLDIEASLATTAAATDGPADPLEELRQRILRRIGEA